LSFKQVKAAEPTGPILVRVLKRGLSAEQSRGEGTGKKKGRRSAGARNRLSFRNGTWKEKDVGGVRGGGKEYSIGDHIQG